MIAVLFEAKAEPEHQARYLQLAAGLKPLLADIDGFIDIERFADDRRQNPLALLVAR
jgi:heme-degrading monooxygenase HmoA